MISSEAELRGLLRILPPDEPLLLQESLTGPMGSLALVVGRDGRLVARFQHTVRRTSRLGTTVVARSVAPDERLAERAAGLLSDSGYFGLAQLDFFDTPHGPVFIDVNPPYYGSMPLACAAGVNLPAAWHSVVTGAATGSPTAYRHGVTYRWLEGDVDAALQGAPEILTRRCAAPKVGDMWARDDPLTSFVYGSQVVSKRAWRRVPERVRRRFRS